MNAGCHSANDANAFQFAGTVYESDGTTPNPGVTIQITSTGGVLLNPPAVSDEGGNFYIYKGTLTNAFPATVRASVCPATDQPMADQVVAGGGGNGNNCHVNGGTTTPMTIADQ